MVTGCARSTFPLSANAPISLHRTRPGEPSIAGGRCTVCESPARYEIDKALATNSDSERSIAKRYGLGHVAIHRHKKHVAAALVQAHQITRREQDINALGGLQRIYTRMNLALDACDRQLWDEERGEYRLDGPALAMMIAASGELRKTIESALKFLVALEALEREQAAAGDEERLVREMFDETLAEHLAEDLAWSFEGLLDAKTGEALADHAAGRLLGRIVERFRG